jgi:hypothetical protein
MNALLVGAAAAAAAWLALGGKGSSRTVKAMPGQTYSVEFTATNIDADQLEKDLVASMQAKGNELESFTRLIAPDHYRIRIRYSEPTPIQINKPIESQGGVVMTTLSVKRVR